MDQLRSTAAMLPDLPVPVPNSPPESTEELLALMRTAPSWDEVRRLRDEAIAQNLDLIGLVVGRFSRAIQSDDLRSIAKCALIEAVCSFVPSRAVPFRAYASQMMRFRVLDYLASQSDAGWILSIEAGRNLRSLRRVLREDGRKPEGISDSELAARCNVSVQMVAQLRWFAKPCGSLSEPALNGEAVSESAIVDERLMDHPPEPGEFLEAADNRAELLRALETLDWRSRFVVERAFGLDGAGPRKQEEIAGILGVTRQRVQQLAAQAISQLRRSWRS